MPLKHMLTSITAGLLALRGARAVFDNTSNSNVAVYWGQNSYGQGSGNLAQRRLSYYCANNDIDIIPLAFMTSIVHNNGLPELNFANQGDQCSTFSGTQLFNCPQLAEDIPLCQTKYNKTILLSIGGATYTEGGFSSADAARAAARLIWSTFGPASSSSSTNTTTLRPFGAAAVDGFDLDFETTVSNMQPFVATLRALMDASSASDGRRRYLTAAPQCPYPDVADNAFLSGPAGDGAGAVAIDAVFVQFYNNYCGLQSFAPNSTAQWNFNFATWDAWARDVAARKGARVFLGVPAKESAAGSGYKAAADLAPIIAYARNFSSFGGVMMWDASQAYANPGFLGAVKSKLKEGKKEGERAVSEDPGTCGGSARRASGFVA